MNLLLLSLSSFLGLSTKNQVASGGPLATSPLYLQLYALNFCFFLAGSVHPTPAALCTELIRRSYLCVRFAGSSFTHFFRS